jgi:flagellar hook protein FlgE
MSLFGSMTTAISGLNAQARALGHISDNVANSQTIGYKRVDTSFEDLLAQSDSSAHTPGAVAARADATNTVQGNIEQVDNPLALAISGQGFFAVSRPTSRTADGTASFDPRQYYSRAGDFQMDRAGYLVNSSGYALAGYPVVNGVVNRNAIQPIRITEFTYQPVATENITLAANLPRSIASSLPDYPDPADYAGGATDPAYLADVNSFNEQAEALAQSTEVPVYNRAGAMEPMQIVWTPTSNTGTNWTLSLNGADGNPLGVNYLDPATGAPVAATGPIRITFDEDTGAMTATVDNAGTPVVVDPSRLTFTNTSTATPGDYLTLSLGEGGAGITQHTGTEYRMRSLTQDGVPPGSYSGISIHENGDVVVNYDNGQSRVAAHVPLITFSDPDKLARQDGQAFTRTMEAGEPRITEAGQDGAGTLVAGAIERSNVDIAAEFSKLIVAQRSYTANTRVVTASDEMLQDTLNMRR